MNQYTQRITAAAALVGHTLPSVARRIKYLEEVINGGDGDNVDFERAIGEHIDLSLYYANVMALCGKTYHSFASLEEYGGAVGYGNAGNILSALVEYPFLIKYLEGTGMWAYWVQSYLEETNATDATDATNATDAKQSPVTSKRFIAAAALLGQQTVSLPPKKCPWGRVHYDPNNEDDVKRRIDTVRRLKQAKVDMCTKVASVPMLNKFLGDIEKESPEELSIAFVKFPFMMRHLMSRGEWVEKVQTYLESTLSDGMVPPSLKW
jgi:hypothetical protein